MDRVEAFQEGYIKRAAEAGINPAEAYMLHKTAYFSDAAGAAAQAAKSLLGEWLPYAAIAGAGMTGITSGLLHHQLTDTTKDDVSIEEMRIRGERLRAEADRIRSKLRERMEKSRYAQTA